ncbi:MAG TPA: LacI family DNA-binding transcriptional regulator [Chitinophagaceae bacterium]|jgi:LacI family transcriptional regulator|nr:LacI family DNA-binding transcriptional regulator [Chitinophagaceae bacterium]
MEPVNIKHLARELNVSISTVSRALRDSHDIGAETKRRVMELARRLNYEPNPYASSLRRQKSRTIAVVIPEIANNFFSLAINGVQTIAQEKGYHVLIYLTHEDYGQETAIIRHLLCGRVDGVLMSLSAQTEDIAHLQEVQRKGVPIVFFDRVCTELETARVTTDDYNSSFKATEHLLEQGCSRIAYLLISPNLSIGIKRMQGYIDALQKHGREADDRLVLQGSHDPERNYALIAQLLCSGQRPDGIFASVERLALTTYQVCRDLHLSIPGDLKIVSFSNLETAPLLQPSLTTITQPAFEIGREAARILFQSFHPRQRGVPHQQVILNSTLMKRASTGYSS